MVLLDVQYKCQKLLLDTDTYHTNKQTNEPTKKQTNKMQNLLALQVMLDP